LGVANVYIYLTVGGGMADSQLDLSVIIPVYNEEENLEPLVSEINQAISDLNFEILFIDDGSTDLSIPKLCKMKENDDKIRIIQHNRNFGKAIALATGFHNAKGKVSITMDGDLQDDPAEIPRFLAEMEKGNTLVCGWRATRRDNVFKRWPSKIYNRLTQYMCGIKVHDMNCGFKAYDTELGRSLNLYGDMHRYTPVLGRMNGARITEIAIEHRPRLHGKSKYGGKRLLRGLFDLITVSFLMTFIERPLHLFGKIGGLLTTAGAGICSYLVGLKYIYGEGIGDRPLLSLGVLLCILGIQFFFLGLLGETIAYNSSGKRDRAFFGKEL
jgi:glycosyltransferase involved in cell wall biosynthesis